MKFFLTITDDNIQSVSLVDSVVQIYITKVHRISHTMYKTAKENCYASVKKKKLCSMDMHGGSVFLLNNIKYSIGNHNLSWVVFR